MSHILLTSSLLILVLLLLRAVFRGRISQRLQYALWGLVLLRLLIPVSLPLWSVPQSLGSTGQLTSSELYYAPVAQGTAAGEAVRPPSPTTPPVAIRDHEAKLPSTDIRDIQGRPATAVDNGTDEVVWYAKSVPLSRILTGLWITETVMTALWMLSMNLRFAHKLRKSRTPYRAAECSLPVYLVERGLPSPCLFGFFRPAVYLTPQAVDSPEALRHVLLHEMTHARHQDPLWSALRCLCLCLYWFDPLVWICAAVSKTDCELACDEGALRGLSQDQRIAYGRTLLALIPVRRGTSPLLSATTMSAHKRHLKDRIDRIASVRRTALPALAVVLLVTLAACGAAFTEGSREEPAKPSQGKDTAQPSSFAGEPVLTLSLEGAEVVEPSPVELTRATADCAQLDTEVTLEGGLTICRYISTNGSTYLAVVRGDKDGGETDRWTADRFYTYTYSALYTQELLPFNALGCSGVAVARPQEGRIVYDLYSFDEEGRPTLLLTMPGSFREADLDGDGEPELLTDAWETILVYRREDRLLRCDVGALLQDAWPELRSLDFLLWDQEAGMLRAGATVALPGQEEVHATAYRYLSLEGDCLLFYKLPNGTQDHRRISLALDQIPESVVEDALRQAETEYQDTLHGEYADDFLPAQPDDWRLSYLSPVTDHMPVPGPRLEIYAMDWEYHAAKPQEVIPAGGAYVDEDGWCGGLISDRPYLVYAVQDGERRLLAGSPPYDCSTDSICFQAGLLDLLLEDQLIAPQELETEHLFTLMRMEGGRFYTLLASWPQEARQRAIDAMAELYLHGTQEQRSDFELAVTSLHAGYMEAPELELYRELMEKAGLSDWLPEA